MFYYIMSCDWDENQCSGKVKFLKNNILQTLTDFHETNSLVCFSLPHYLCLAQPCCTNDGWMGGMKRNVSYFIGDNDWIHSKSFSIWVLCGFSFVHIEWLSLNLFILFWFFLKPCFFGVVILLSTANCPLKDKLPIVCLAFVENLPYLYRSFLKICMEKVQHEIL